jgi:chromosomal replication initiator protein
MILTPEHIEILVCSEYSVTPEQLKGKCRKREFVIPRQLFTYLLKYYCPHLSLKSIGRIVGKEREKGTVDHATVIHSLSSINDYLDDMSSPTLRKSLKNFIEEVQKIFDSKDNFFQKAS